MITRTVYVLHSRSSGKGRKPLNAIPLNRQQRFVRRNSIKSAKLSDFGRDVTIDSRERKCLLRGGYRSCTRNTITVIVVHGT